MPTDPSPQIVLGVFAEIEKERGETEAVLMVRTEGNSIIFEGDLRSEARGALVSIFQLTQRLGYQDIVLDFSKVRYVDANLMLPLSRELSRPMLK
jgi:hypothetical protein